VLAVGATRPLIQALIPDYERSTGNKVKAWSGPPALIQQKLASGEEADVVFSFDPTWSELESAGKVEKGTPIARAGIGVGVRKGSPLPDLTTEESTKAFLLQSRAISGGGFNTGSVGSWVLRAFNQMGITEQMLPKYKRDYKTGTAIIEAVVKGETDVVLSVMPDLADSTLISYAGPFPREIQQYDVALGAVTTSSNHEKDAREFLKRVKAASPDLLASKWLYPLD
jgi:molybdate transport system substrate-binding protein